MSDFRKYLNKQLDNKEFKKEWDNSKNEYDLAKSQVAARKEDVTWKSKAYYYRTQQQKNESISYRKDSASVVEPVTSAMAVTI